MLRKILSYIFFALILTVSLLIYNSLSLKSKQITVDPVDKINILDSCVDRLSRAVQIKTISFQDESQFDSSQFHLFESLLDSVFPKVQRQLEKTVINHHSLLYKWEGKNESLAPILLTGHLDVVPVDPIDSAKWHKPPFDGLVSNDTIYGRGTMDDKVSVMAILESVEYLLSTGFIPERTIYLAFGHDEEKGGQQGASSIATYLYDKKISPEFVLDEGYTITQGLVPGVLNDVALIGISEKGFATVQLKATLEGGHASIPQKESAIELISAALVKLEKHPFDPRISEPVGLFLDHISPHMRFQDKLALANKKLFKSLIIANYQNSGPGSALVQTTLSPTILKAGLKDNVIPSEASVTLNARILPGSSINDVVEHIRTTIDEPRISISLKPEKSEPSPVSSLDSKGYHAIQRTIKEVYPDVLCAPNLFVAFTDGRHYHRISENVYRFLPIRLNSNNVNSIHGVNEKIGVEEYKDVIRFYVRMIENINSSQ